MMSDEPPVSEPVRPKRVLIVDDNQDIAQMLSAIIKLLGHDVATANDGYEAIELAPTYKPEVILLDIGLPGIDGYEVARRLRSQGFSKSLMVAVSGYGQDSDREQSLAAGFDQHLVKPVTIATLAVLLDAPPPRPR